MSDTAKKVEMLHSSNDPSNQSLIDDLYRRYWRELCHFLKARYGSGPPEPEDIAQATFMKFSTLKDPEKILNPRAFLYRTARNLQTDEYRRKATRDKFREEESQQDELEIYADSEPECVLLQNEAAKSLEIALHELEERERDFLLLHRLHNLSYTEIAKLANMSRNGAKAVIHKALGKCEKSLRNLDHKSLRKASRSNADKSTGKLDYMLSADFSRDRNH